MVQLKDKKYDLAEITRHIELARRSPFGKPVEFSALEIDGVLAILGSGIDFHPQVVESDQKTVIWNAIRSAANAGVVDRETLMEHLKKAESEYLSQPIQDYVLITSINVKFFIRLRRVTLDDAILTFLPVFPKLFKRDDIQYRIGYLNLEQPMGLTFVRIRVKARTSTAAYENASFALDLLRGFWNFSINESILTRYFSIQSDPINHIRLGPIHTIHYPNGTLASSAFWYESPYTKPKGIFDLEPKWDNAIHWTKYILTQLKHIVYADELKSLFVRYNRSLDLANNTEAFYKLWSVLEHLTFAIADHGKVINRTLFLSIAEERNYLRLLLSHLRDVRNGFVHHDKTRQDTHLYLYQLKLFVERLFRFHLAQGHYFTSIQEAGEFLDLPTDPAMLSKAIKEKKRSIELYDKALRFQTPGADSPS